MTPELPGTEGTQPRETPERRPAAPQNREPRGGDRGPRPAAEPTQPTPESDADWGLDDIPTVLPDHAEVAGPSTADAELPGQERGRRRRRRRGRRSRDGAAEPTPAPLSEPALPESEQEDAEFEAAFDDFRPEDAEAPALAVAGPEGLEVPQVYEAGDTAGRCMLINVAEGDECRIAILRDGRLEELFIERASAESHVGNIYKGRITNVEPSIQAAFVDFGLAKNGFLHISDLQPQYFPGGSKLLEEVGRKTPRRDRPPIQKCLRRGQEVIVQVIKEGIGTKGPTLTTYVSIPGRYLVMMPGMNRLGVSRKIEDEDARRKMRAVLEELELPGEVGFILRTAGLDRTRKELQQDLNYLTRLWKVVSTRIKNQRPPCELYQESDLVIRTIRDVFSPDFSRIVVDDVGVAEKVRDFLSIAMPRTAVPVELYAGRRPLFHEYNLEAEIDRINSRYVPLASGGSLVIESTEALVAIDVNSGRFREHDDAEETAFRINLEAAPEIARQLRLRDLGGLILCDFVDMRMEKHRRGVERALRDALKNHKERAKCLRMSQFGIIEMTRQRMRPSIKRSIYQDCPHCRGSGLVKNPESMTLDIMRLLRLATNHDQVDTVEVRVARDVEFQLQNRKRRVIQTLEEQNHRKIVIKADGNLGPDQYVFECYDNRGGVIRVLSIPESRGGDPFSKRRGQQPEARAAASHDEDRQTLEDVFD